MPFAPGHKTPGRGRPKGFKGVAKDIMRRTKNGKELIDFALETFRDEERMHHVRWEAMCWLADRGFGKPVAQIELHAALQADYVGPPPKLDVSKLSAIQRSQLRQLLEKMTGRGEVIDVRNSDDVPVLRLVDSPDDDPIEE